ncbi:MAG TPA: PAS domain-containing protein, partial [Polyangiaceae bacterium]|nr:PAS domain-containing protein [Polyangiaceae bacterium]
MAFEHEVVELRARVRELEQELARLAGADERALGARAQAQALLDNIPHMAWMKNIAGIFLAVNEPFARACGRPKTEILGKTDREIWPLEHAERYMRDDRRVVEAGEQLFAEEPIADGGAVEWFE